MPLAERISLTIALINAHKFIQKIELDPSSSSTPIVMIHKNQQKRILSED